MKISAIRVYQIDLPVGEGRYSWAGGKHVEVFDSTVVALETDSGLEGHGEACPLGPVYLPAYGPGIRTGIAELAPHLLGLDPCNLTGVNATMDAALLGHAYVKSAIDMACWDLLGKRLGAPVCELLGGPQGDSVALYRAITQQPPEEMAANVAQYRAAGYRRFQLKVGGSPLDDIARIRTVRSVLEDGDILVADANTGWLTHEAMQVVNAIADLDVYVEQPCRSYEESLTVRKRTTLPFVLDENIDGLQPLLTAHSDGAADVVNLKISKLGGLTKTRLIRDVCVGLGIPMTLEDSWGGDIVTSAIIHLAHSTPERFRFSATDFNSYVTVSNATGAPQRVNGRMSASSSPGLGIEPNWAALGDPIARHAR